MSIRHRFVIHMMIFAGLLAMSGLVSLQVGQQMRTAFDLFMRSSTPEIVHGFELHAAFQAVHIRVDEMILSGALELPVDADTGAMGNFAWDSDAVDPLLAQIRRLLSTIRNATQEAIRIAQRANDPETAAEESYEIEEWLNPMSRAVDRYFAGITELRTDFGGSTTAHKLRLHNELDHVVRTEIQPLIKAYQEDSFEELKEEADEIDQALRTSFASIGWFTIVSVGSALVLASRLATSISAPLGRLRDAADAFGRGNMKARVQLSRNDEIGHLGNAFDTMAERLENTAREVDHANRMRQAAEEKAHRRLRELAHLNRVSTMGEMAAGLAHELNQPLGAISAYADSAVRFLGRGEEGHGHASECMRKASEQSLRAGQIIRRLREYARNQPATPAACSIPVLMRDSQALLADEVRSHAIEVEIWAEPGAEMVWADAVQIEQVLVNILRNAIEALASNPPELRRIALGARNVDRRSIEVTVADNGPGHQIVNLEALFDSFYTNKSNGMGIGLSVCRTIVDAHGGKLWATRNSDRGLTFHFTLTPCEDSTGPNAV